MFNQTLALKIIVFVIVIFVVFAYLNFKAEERQMIAKSKRMAELLSIAIYRGLSEAMLQGEGKMQEVQKMIESYGTVEEINEIRIFDPENGSILVDADKDNIRDVVDQQHVSTLKAKDKDGQSALSFRDNRQVLSIVTPILNRPECYQCHEPQRQVLGALDIDVSAADMFSDIARSRSRMMRFALLAIIVVSLVIVLLVIYSVDRPIKELTTTMSRVESGDLTARAHIASHSELGRLANSFNSMTAKLREDIERLEALHKTAEDLRSTMVPDEIERTTIQGIIQGMGFERVALLLVDQEGQMLEGRAGIGVTKDIVKNVRIPLRREYGILARTVLDAESFNVQRGMYDVSLTPEKAVRCWEFHQCDKVDCPAYSSDDLRCWLQSETHCRGNVQMDFQNKTEVCCQCPVIQEAYGKEAALGLLMFGSEAFATVPLMAQDKATGVIMVDNLHSKRPITDEDIKGLSVFAGQAAIAIENAKLYGKLESRIEAADEELRRKITALTEVKNLNDSILQNMSNGLITMDMEGKIVYFNSAAEAILGYKAQELKGRPVKGLFNGLERLVSETLQEGKSFTFHEIETPTKAGYNIPIEVSTSLLNGPRVRGDAGEATGVVVIFTDLTERKQMEEQIRRAGKLATLGQLAAGIAHEIRNPLAGISGAIQILRDDIPENDMSREILDEIVEKINILNASISNFLRFTRPAPLQLSPTDINEVVQSVLFLMSKQAEAQGVSIEEEYEDGLPIVMADSEQIQQVILNIALNALQAIGEEGGRVLFKTFQANAADQIVIEISDTGVGIPAEKVDQIFDPYFTTKVEGTGLGLSIAQRIVEEHGGSISVKSEVGRGTTFGVSLLVYQSNGF